MMMSCPPLLSDNDQLHKESNDYSIASSFPEDISGANSSDEDENDKYFYENDGSCYEDDYYEVEDSIDIFEYQSKYSLRRLQDYSEAFKDHFHKADLKILNTTSTTVTYLLTFSLEHMSLSLEQQQGLQERFELVSLLPLEVEITIDLNIGKIEIQNISQSDSISSSTPVPLPKSMVLARRLSEYLVLLPFKCDSNASRSDAIANVMMMYYCTASDASETLQRWKWDTGSAIQELFDRSASQLPPAQTPSAPPVPELTPLDLCKVYLHDDLGDDPEREALIIQHLYDLQDLSPTADLVSLYRLFQSNYYSYRLTVETILHTITTNEKQREDRLPVAKPFLQLDSLKFLLEASPHFTRHRVDITHPNKFITLLHLIEGELLDCLSRCSQCNCPLDQTKATSGNFIGFQEIHLVVGVGICDRQQCHRLSDIPLALPMPDFGDRSVERELYCNSFGLDLWISLFYSAVQASNQSRLELLFPSTITEEEALLCPFVAQVVIDCRYLLGSLFTPSLSLSLSLCVSLCLSLCLSLSLLVRSQRIIHSSGKWWSSFLQFLRWLLGHNFLSSKKIYV
jgi:hypothetical protein